MSLRKISRALISVSDKKGLVDFAKGLADQGVMLISTGGTARALRDAGLAVSDVSEITNFPEMMDGRVKTLHPMVHGGLLALRDKADHATAMKEHAIAGIDLLVCNLYPFEATVARGADFETTIENIDIGGPAMTRSAAKNHDWVTVVVDVEDYGPVLEEMKEAGVFVVAGGLDDATVLSADATSGTVVITDGPFAETKEFLGGFTAVDVPDDGGIEMWAGKIAEACGWPQEVRRFG